MAKKKANVLGYVFLGLVIVALVLVIVGMFVGQVVAKGELFGKTSKEVIKLFDSDAWGVEEIGDEKVGVSNAFAIVSFIVTLVGLATLVADGVLRLFAKKDVKVLRACGAIVTLVGAILILVSGLVMVGQCKDAEFDFAFAKATYSTGAGIWLGFIGGLVGAVGGALPLFKAFD